MSVYYVFVSNLGKNNELRAADMKASYQTVQADPSLCWMLM